MNAINIHSIDGFAFRLHGLRLSMALCALLLAVSLAPAHAQPEPDRELSAGVNHLGPADLRHADMPTLKAAYLDCDPQAGERLLAQNESLRCSQVREALLVRVFKGDFSQLLAWWNTEKAQRPITQAAQVSNDAGTKPWPAAAHPG